MSLGLAVGGLAVALCLWTLIVIKPAISRYALA